MAGIEFERIEHVRAYEAIVEKIQDAIYDGRLSPASRLPSERELMSQFGVGRTTVREALRVLESGGLVKSRPGDPQGGAEVQEFSPDVLQKTLLSLVHLEHVDPVELIEFRMIMESASCYLAARFRTGEQLRKIEARQEELLRHAVEEHQDAFHTADAAFHKELAVSSGNALVRACSEVVRNIVFNLMGEKLMRADDRSELMVETAKRHDRILDAIRDKDGLKASAFAKQDIVDYYGPWLGDAASSRLSDTANSNLF